jgi:phosphate-selective porin OprO/OprP
MTRYLVTLFLGFLLVAPVRANDEALLELLKALHENGTIDTATYQKILVVAEDGKPPEPTSTKVELSDDIRQVVETEMAEASKDQPEITTEGKFEVTSADKEFSFRVGGRIQVDAATYSEDQLQHNDGTEFRRARLFVQGRLWDTWGYKLQYDFTGSGRDGLQDAYLDYNGIDKFKIRTGHFKEPFSLQNMTSSKYITFMERALPHVFTPSRNLGVSLMSGGRNWTAAAGMFGEGRDSAGGEADEGYGFSGRLTYGPNLADGSQLHLGGSASYRDTGSDDLVRLRERPESHLTDVRLVDTGNIDTDSYSRFVMESAWIKGPFSIAGEYYYLLLDRAIADNPSLDLSGYYLEGGWFLTGESMNYSASKGAFGKITPKRNVGKGGFGAWQIAARFSNVNLTDKDIDGGEERNLTLGVNWFTTPNIRFSANYVNVLKVDGGPASGDEPDIFQLRSQVEF